MFITILIFFLVLIIFSSIAENIARASAIIGKNINRHVMDVVALVLIIAINVALMYSVVYVYFIFSIDYSTLSMFVLTSTISFIYAKKFIECRYLFNDDEIKK